IPITTFPLWLRPLSYALPLTYGVDMLKDAISSAGTIPLWISLVALLVYSVGLFTISTHNIKKRWIY
ncbi:MAG: ABC transporter permease, partial [Candidatus Izemoplasmataceae bacterium]